MLEIVGEPLPTDAQIVHVFPVEHIHRFADEGGQGRATLHSQMLEPSVKLVLQIDHRPRHLCTLPLTQI